VFLAAFYFLISIFVVKGVAIVGRSELDARPEQHLLPVKNVEFSSREGGLNLEGWYIATPEKEHTIILIHGFGGNRASGPALGIGSALWRNGFNVLLFDLRASGKSEGDMASGGYFEQEDLLGAFDFVRKTGIPDGNIGVLGFSMGAATSILGASKEPGIQAVVADGAYATISDLIGQEVARATAMPMWMVPLFEPGISVTADLLFGIKLDEVAPAKAAAKINYPILLIHGTDDTRVPVEQSIRVHKLAPIGTTLWKVEGAGHVGSFNKDPNKYIETIIGYFRARFALPASEIIGNYN